MELQLKKPELEEYVDAHVKAGNFPTREAMVEDALLRVMADDVELTPEDLAEIEMSRDEISQGDVVDSKDFSARIRKKYGIPDA